MLQTHYFLLTCKKRTEFALYCVAFYGISIKVCSLTEYTLTDGMDGTCQRNDATSVNDEEGWAGQDQEVYSPVHYHVSH